MKAFKLESSKILLLVFITVFMFLGAGKAFDHKITHSSPTGLMASDAFTHDWVSQNTLDNGYFNKPPEYSFGSNEEYLQESENYKLFHSPILPFITSSISRIAGLNVYDVDVIVIFCLISLMVLLSYFILAKFNETLALFSLPLSLLFLQRKFFISLTWGWWNFLIAEFFLFAVILLILGNSSKHRYILNAILISAAFISHGMEAGYAAIFIAFYLAFNFFFDRKEFFKLFIEQIKSLLLVILFGGYYLIILFKTMGSMGYSQVRFMSNAEFIEKAYNGVPANYFIYFNEFINFRFLLVIGCLILLYILWQKKNQLIAFWLFVIFMSFSPYLYVVAGERGYQWRFLWPIFLSFAFGAIGLAAHYFAKNYLRKISKILIFAVMFASLLIIVYPLQFQGAGVVGDTEYDSYRWMHENTDPYSNFLVMYAPQNSQITSLYMMKRNIFVSRPEIVNTLNLSNDKMTELINPHMTVDFFCKKEDCSLLGESNFLKFREEGEDYYENRSICFFDYIYMSLRNYEEINKINAAYLQNLIDKNISSIVFNNGGAVIAKNTVKGEECERRFRH
jgi:hypothetical protein